MSDKIIQDALGLDSESNDGPVECLGEEFDSDSARREHYLNLLREKLKDPEFRNQPGFPIGEDEDILALSDPPYYTACPNPWIAKFIEQFGRPSNKNKRYHRDPFAADVSEGKTHKIYKSHSYHTKVPHRAIMRYILHYTNPGDIVFDGFAGTGMTAVAARLCGDRAEVTELGYRVLEDGGILDEKGERISDLGPRRAIINDLSPVASFIAKNLNFPPPPNEFKERTTELLKTIENECRWMYSTIIGANPDESAAIVKKIDSFQAVHELRDFLSDEEILRKSANSDSRSIEIANVHFFVISDVFSCPQCASEIIYYDTAVGSPGSKVAKTLTCPSCSSVSSKENLDRLFSSDFDQRLDRVHKLKKTSLRIKSYTSSSGRSEGFVNEIDLAIEKAIERFEESNDTPLVLPKGSETQRNVDIGVECAHQFYTPRNRFSLNIAKKICEDYPPALFAITGITNSVSKLYRWTPSYEGGGPLSGTLYIPSILRDISVIDAIKRFFQKLPKVYESIYRTPKTDTIISTNSFQFEMAESLDYIFLDPPFGANLNYSELSILWEFTLGVRTNQEFEAIEHQKVGKTLEFYRKILLSSFQASFKMLKPGRWMTVEFSNTKASVWNSIQSTIQEAGFIVANVSALVQGGGSSR